MRKGNLVCNDHRHAKFVGQTLQTSEEKSQMLLPIGELASADVIRPVFAHVVLFRSTWGGKEWAAGESSYR